MFLLGAAAASDTGIPWPVIVPALAAAIAALLSYLGARRSAKSASSTQTIELGVTQLVDQYRKANAELEEEVHECAGKCRELEASMTSLEKKVESLKKVISEKDTVIDNYEAQISGLLAQIGRQKNG